MHTRTTRPWLVAGLAHVAFGVVLGLALAAPVAGLDPFAHFLVLSSGAAMLGLALLLGLAPAFLRRDWPAPFLTHAAIGLAVVGDALWLASWAMGEPDLRLLLAPHGLALMLGAAHVPLLLVAGRPWGAGVDVLAPGQPYRQGDAASASAFGVGLLGLVAASALLLAPARGVPTAGLAALLLGFLLPTLLGALLFLLPREARTPLKGATLVGAALAVHALAVAALLHAFIRPVGADFLYPTAGVALGYVLAATALLRVRPPDEPAERLARTRPLLLTGLILLGFAVLTSLLSVSGRVPNNLLPVALYVHFALALCLAAAALVLAAPLTLPGRPRAGSWPKWAGAVAIMGLFLLAPHFQYPRSAFPGAVVLALAALLLVAGLAPLARAATASPGAGSRRGRRMRRR